MRMTTARTASFGPYALDLRSGELRKFGTKVKMGEQPFQILLILLERPGEMVTREEIRDKLWTDDTFVDFDHGLNSAVQRLRDCLSDSAGKPRWIETLPRRGYRFVGEVQWTRPNGAVPTPSAPEATVVEPARTAPEQKVVPPAARPRLIWRFVALAAALLLAAAIVGIAYGSRGARPAVSIRSLAVLPLENLSGDPAQDFFADGMTDELITMLAKNPSLRVVSRTSVMQYKKAH